MSLTVYLSVIHYVFTCHPLCVHLSPTMCSPVIHYVFTCRSLYAQTRWRDLRCRPFSATTRPCSPNSSTTSRRPQMIFLRVGSFHFEFARFFILLYNALQTYLHANVFSSAAVQSASKYGNIRTPLHIIYRERLQVLSSPEYESERGFFTSRLFH